MRKLTVLFLAAFLLAAVPSFAADYAPFEIFGGYNFVHLGYTGDSLGKSTNGFDAAFTGNINEMIGIKGEFGWHRGSGKSQEDRIAGVNLNGNIKPSAFSFMVGPQFNYRNDSIVTPFAHALFGLANVRFNSDISASVGSANWKADNTASSNAFAMALGAGADISMGDKWAIRGQFDYFPWLIKEVILKDITLKEVSSTGLGDIPLGDIPILGVEGGGTGKMNNIRLAVGVVYKIGSK